MPTSETRAWHRVMPTITVIAISCYVLGPAEGAELCVDCPQEAHTGQEVRPAYTGACSLALGTDLDTGPETASFAARQACAESRLGDLGSYLLWLSGGGGFFVQWGVRSLHLRVSERSEDVL